MIFGLAAAAYTTVQTIIVCAFFDSDCILDVDIWLPFSKVDGSSVGRNSTVWPMREESAAFMNYTQTPADYLTNNSQINGEGGA